MTKEVESLPPVPLSEDVLAKILRLNDKIDEIWRLKNPPKNVYTQAGKHEGNILKFWIEFPDRYVAVEYQSGELGLCWQAKDPAEKDTVSGKMAEETLSEWYIPVSSPDAGETDGTDDGVKA